MKSFLVILVAFLLLVPGLSQVTASHEVGSDCDAHFGVGSAPWVSGDALAEVVQDGTVKASQSYAPDAYQGKTLVLSMGAGLERGASATLRITIDGHDTESSKTVPATGTCNVVYGTLTPDNEAPDVAVGFQSESFSDVHDLSAAVTITDPDGDELDPATYQWSRIRDDAEAVLSGQTGTVLSSAHFDAGDVLKISVDVKDEWGGRTTTSSQVKVGSFQDVPIASLVLTGPSVQSRGTDLYKVAEGVVVILDASGSTDGPQEPQSTLEFAFDPTGTTPDHQLTFTGDATNTFTPTGDADPRVRVRDEGGLLGQATIQVLINQAPTTSLNLPQTVQTEDTVTAAVSLADPDNQSEQTARHDDLVATVTWWTADDGGQGDCSDPTNRVDAEAESLSGEGPLETTAPTVPSGGRCLGLDVTGSDGFAEVSATEVVLVSNTPPTLTASLAPATTADDLMVWFAASDADGDALTCTVEWLLDGAVQETHTQEDLECAAGSATLSSTQTSAGDAWAARIAATDGEATSDAVTSNQVTITVGPAHHFTLDGPASVVAGQESTAFTLQVLDVDGNPTTASEATTFDVTSDSTGTVTFFDAEGGQLPDDQLGLPSGAGLTAFTYQDTKAPSTVVVTATWLGGDEGLDGDSEAHALDVLVGPAVTLAITSQPVGGKSGEILAVQPVLEIRDAEGNVASDDSVTEVTVTIQFGADGFLGGAVTATAVDGIVTFTDVTLAGSVDEPYVLRFTDTTPDRAAEDLLPAADSDAVIVTAGAATQYLVSASKSNPVAGEEVTVTAQLVDANGNPVATSGVEVTWSSSNGGSFSSATSTTDENGVALNGFTTSVTAGTTHVVTAITDDLAGDSVSITTVGGAATQIVFTSSEDDLASGLGRTLRIEVLDANGNPANHEATITITKESGTGTVTGLGTAQSTAGVATLPITAEKAGEITIQAAAADLTPATTTFEVVVGSSATVAVETAADGSGVVVAAQDVVSGSSITVYSVVRDEAGNFVENAAAQWSLESKSGGVTDGALATTGDAKSAVFTGGLVGTATIRASMSGLTAIDSDTITVIAGAAATVELSGDATDLASGDARPFTATIQDAAGNPVTTGSDSTLKIGFTQSAGTGIVAGLCPADEAMAGVKTCMATGVKSGEITLLATLRNAADDAALATDDLRFAVIAGTPATIAVETAVDGSGAVVSAQDVVSGSSITVYSVVRDEAGNFVENAAAQWSLESKSGGVTDGALATTGDAKSAVFTGGLVGTATIRAAMSGLAPIDSETITVITGAAAQYLVSASKTNPLAGEDITITAQLADANGNPVASEEMVAWGSSNGGSFSGATSTTDESGVARITLTTSATAGTTHVVTATTGEVSGDSAPITTVAGPATQLVFTSSEDDLAPGAPRTLGIEVQDENGNLANHEATITFTKESGVGTVTGLGTAQSTAGVATLPVTGEQAGEITIQAAAAGLVPASTTFKVLPLPPMLTITGPSADIWHRSSSVEVTYTTTGSATSTECSVGGVAVAGSTGSCTLSLGDGVHAVTVRVEGPGGSSEEVLNVRVDTTPPSVSLSPSGGAKKSTWYTSAVTFKASATDAGSKVATCDADAVYDGPSGTGRTLTLSCIDRAGNQGTGTVTFDYDDEAPAASVAAPAWINADGGNVRFLVSDAGSGVASFSPQFRIDGGDWQALAGDGDTRTIPAASEGAVIDFRLQATDNVGHVRGFPDAPDATTRVDQTPPPTPSGLQTSPRAGGAFLLEWQSPDGGDGAPITTYVLEHRAPGGTFQSAGSGSGSSFTASVDAVDGSTHEFRVAAVDAAGNQGAFSSAMAAVAHNRVPDGVLVVTSTTHGDGAALGGEVSFSWTALTPGPGESIAYRYALSRDAELELTSSAETTTETSAEFTDVAPGTWYFHVLGVGVAGVVEADALQFEVLAPVSVEEAAKANKDVTVRLEQRGDDVLVSWTLSEDAPAPVAGVQVWSIDEDGTLGLLATIEKDDADFASGSYSAPPANGYVVTQYYENGEGLFTLDALPSSEQYAAWNLQVGAEELTDTSGARGGMLRVLLVLGGAFVLLGAIGTGVFLLVRARRAGAPA